jgi:hypothetical protein
MSAIDQDLLSIQRRRRQQRRCLHCGTPTPRAALCRTCRQTRRYCPRCETVWEANRPRGPWPTEYCPPCHNVAVNGEREPRERYLAKQRASMHPKLRQIIKLYRAGATYPAIAAALGIPRSALGSIIHHARQTGRWPKHLERGRDWRRGCDA